jgi:Rubrerythrin
MTIAARCSHAPAEVDKVSNRNRITITFAIFGLAMSVVVFAQQAPNKTLANLQSAYNGESNAHAKYLEFAKQADSEGYAKVASLFRAAAAAEQIHLTCEAAVIREMDAMPQADVKTAPVKSTKQNLEDSANKARHTSAIRCTHSSSSRLTRMAMGRLLSVSPGPARLRPSILNFSQPQPAIWIR